MSKPRRLARFHLAVVLGKPTESLTRSLGHTSTTQLEAPKKATEARTPQRRVKQPITIPRVLRTPRHKSSKQMEGEMKFLW
jgi:hypothetical protein